MTHDYRSPRLIALIILIVGFAISLHGFLADLPYQLEPDEPNLWLRADALATNGEFISPYPPLGLIELALEHQLLYLITPDEQLAQPIFYVFGRYFSILYSLIFVSLAYQTGRQLHSSSAGIGAMLFLVAQPNAIHITRLIKIDNLAWLFGMAAILLSVRMAKRKKKIFLIPITLLCFAAVATKYTMLPILILPTLVSIVALPEKPMTRNILAGLLVIGTIIAFYIIANPSGILSSFLMSFHARQLYNRESFFQFISLSYAWTGLLEQLGQLNFWGLPVVFIVATWVYPRVSLSKRQWLLLCTFILMMVTTFFLLGLFRTNRVQDRYLIVLGFGLLWGWTLALISSDKPLVVTALSVLLISPWLIKGWQSGSELLQLDTRAATANFFIDTIPEGVHIAVEYDSVEFEAGYGGYPSQKIYFVENILSVHEESLEYFARRGIEYVVVDERNIHRGGFYDEAIDSTDFLALTQSVYNLDDPYNNDMRGPRRIIFRIPPLQQQPMHIFLGEEIIFKGYDLNEETFKPEGSLDLVLYWAALGETEANYTVFAQILAEGNHIVAQLDGLPGDALHRTYDWWSGYFDWDEWPIQLPLNILPGEYRLVVGMYDSDTFIRLTAVDADGILLGDSILLETFTIED